MKKLVETTVVIGLAEEILDDCSILELLDEEDVEDIPLITAGIRRAAEDLIELTADTRPTTAEGGVD